MKVKLFIVILLLCCGHSSIAQNSAQLKSQADSVEYVKTKMRQLREVNSYAIGFAGQQSMQFQGFLFLLNTLDNEQWLKLTKDTSACLRAYAYAALVHNRHKGMTDVEKNFLKDSTQVPVMFGCIGGDMTVAALVANVSNFYNRKFVNQLLAEYYTGNLFWHRRLFQN
ncbi:hypothetical protein [Flavisolibacter tropicus]|uniref:Uncharacterized protein n=1 Tax=Flavisolibacter tropicus TaxID=1492898 RepID=A0A172TX74_9BACT|nr:hypothetical protein [Flavisolibacter tropicus]ANE51711.1 hypothetical protein SY85_15590 [Flavisolibacter tropicus]